MTEPYELMAKFAPIKQWLQPLLPGYVIHVSMTNKDFDNAADVFEAPYEISIYENDGEWIPRCIARQRIEQSGDIKILIDKVNDCV